MKSQLPAELPPAARPLADIIPDHKLIRVIGRGSYGEVWLARNVMGEFRAVKIVHRAAFGGDSRPFEREFEGIRKFEPISRSHESQLPILHVGLHEAAGCFYYVMELADDADVAAGVPPAVEGGVSPSEEGPATPSAPLRRTPIPPGGTPGSTAGEDARRYIPHTLRLELERHGRLPLAQCLDIGLALTTALAHLHRHGLVHRDIKPSNIIFVQGRPKLADIGLVTDAGDARSIVGTEGYLAPEGPGSPQADLYSLGKVLYEISTGRDRRHFPDLPLDLAPRPLSSPLNVGSSALNVERSTSNAQRPTTGAKADNSQSAIGNRKSEITQGLLELNEILLKACARDPRERYQSAEEMHAELVRLLQGVSIRQVRRAERVWREVRRGAKWAAVVAVVLSVGLFASRTGRQPAPRAVERRSTNEVANRFFDLGLHAFERLAVTDIPLAVTNFQKAIEADPGFARAHAELALIYSRPQSGKGNQESYAAAKSEAELALTLDPALPLGHIVVGWSKVFHGFHWRDAEKDFLRALELDPHWDRGHHGYAEFLKASGRTEQAVAEMREALRRNAQSVRVRQRLPWVLVAARRFEEAIKEAEDAIAMEPNSVGNAHYALIDAWCALRNFPKAIEAQQRLLLAERTSSEEITLRIGNLRKAFEMDGAKGYWRVQLKATQQMDDSPYWLARVHAQLGEREQALDCLNACLRDVAFDLIWSVKIDWQLDPLRSDPAFQGILKALNLE